MLSLYCVMLFKTKSRTYPLQCRTLFGAFDPSLASQNGAFLADAGVYEDPIPEYLTSPVSSTNVNPSA